MTDHFCTVSERVHRIRGQRGAAASQREVILVRDEFRRADERAREDLVFHQRVVSRCLVCVPLHIAQFYLLAHTFNLNVWSLIFHHMKLFNTLQSLQGVAV